MKKIITSFNKAEYFFRPSQFFRRLRLRESGDKLVEATLPWGYKIHVSPEEDIGKAILTLGLYDLTVSEVITRLCKLETTPKVVLDIGANIGYMTSVLSHSLKEEDTIFAFEPHPQIFLKLKTNTINWTPGPQITLMDFALSNSNDEIDLMIPSEFSVNEGLGFLATNLTQDKIKNAIVCQKVKTKSLDSLWAENVFKSEEIFLMKIDTEGNELLVLEGAEGLLKEKRIKNIIFEEHLLYPAPSMLFLEKLGYTIFFLKRGLFSPQYLPVKETTSETWEPNNFLATIDPTSAKNLLAPLGWQILR